MPFPHASSTLTPSNFWLRLPPNFRGIIWLSMGAFLFAVVDVFVKSLGGRFDPFQILFFRYGCGLIFLVPVFIGLGAANMKTERLPLHLLRMDDAEAEELDGLVPRDEGDELELVRLVDQEERDDKGDDARRPPPSLQQSGARAPARRDGRRSSHRACSVR